MVLSYCLYVLNTSLYGRSLFPFSLVRDHPSRSLVSRQDCDTSPFPFLFHNSLFTVSVRVSDKTLSTPVKLTLRSPVCNGQSLQDTLHRYRVETMGVIRSVTDPRTGPLMLEVFLVFHNVSHRESLNYQKRRPIKNLPLDSSDECPDGVSVCFPQVVDQERL